MSQALTISHVETEIDNLAPQFAALLPPDVPADKFRQVALAAIRNNPDLLRCEPQSLFNACMNAAQDGLMPDGREGAIVPRKGKAVWQVMIQGIYKRVKTSGSVATLAANVVYDGETFEVLLGDDDRIVHRRDMAKVKRGAEVAAYAIATLKDGTKEREVMSWDQVETVRKSSSMPNSGPWTLWGDEMARKTVVRRLAKRLPVIDPADEALQRTIGRVDSLYDFGTPAQERPTIEADNADVPLKAVAANTPRAPVKRAPVDADDAYQAPARPRVDRSQWTDAQWQAWVEKFGPAVAALYSRQDVVDVAEKDSVKDALQYGSERVREEVSKILSDGYKRFPEPVAEEPDPDLEIVGEKYAAG